MKFLLATLALTCSGAAFAVPTTVYFAGSTFSHQSVDTSSNSWVSSGAARQFSGSVTIDGTQGTLGGLSSPWTEEVLRRTDSRCAVASDGSCYDGPPAPSNVLGFSFSLDGVTYKQWSAPTTDSVVSMVIKSRWVDGSRYTAVVSGGARALLGSTSQGERARSAYQSLGLSLAGDAQAMGDLLNLAQLPDLSSLDLAASVLRFSSGAYVCTETFAGCQDLLLEAGSIVVEGQLSYLGVVPPSVAEVSEPASVALVLVGLVGLAGLRHRRLGISRA